MLLCKGRYFLLDCHGDAGLAGTVADLQDEGHSDAGLGCGWDLEVHLNPDLLTYPPR